MSLCTSNQMFMWLYGRELILTGYTTKTVMIETGLSYKQMQKLLGCLSDEGLIVNERKKAFKKTAAKLLSDHGAKYQASILMQIYHAIAADDYKKNISISALNNAYNLYISIYSELSSLERIQRPHISISDSWILANELRSGEAAIEECRNCKSLYYSSENQLTSIDCPFCYEGRDIKRRKITTNEVEFEEAV